MGDDTIVFIQKLGTYTPVFRKIRGDDIAWRMHPNHLRLLGYRRGRLFGCGFGRAQLSPPSVFNICDHIRHLVRREILHSHLFGLSGTWAAAQLLLPKAFPSRESCLFFPFRSPFLKPSAMRSIIFLTSAPLQKRDAGPTPQSPGPS